LGKRPNLAKNAGQAADSASGGFLCHIVLMLLQEACTACASTAGTGELAG